MEKSEKSLTIRGGGSYVDSRRRQKVERKMNDSMEQKCSKQGNESHRTRAPDGRSFTAAYFQIPIQPRLRVFHV